MAYTKTDWIDRVVEKPNTFTITENSDGSITLTPAPGQVIERGTPINAENLNNIEEGVLSAHDNLLKFLRGEVALQGNLDMSNCKLLNLQAIRYGSYEYLGTDLTGNSFINGLGNSIRLGQNNTDYIRMYKPTVNHAAALALVEPVLARLTSSEYTSPFNIQEIDELMGFESNLRTASLQDIYEDTDEGIGVDTNAIIAQLITKVNGLTRRVEQLEANKEGV